MITNKSAPAASYVASAGPRESSAAEIKSVLSADAISLTDAATPTAKKKSQPSLIRLGGAPHLQLGEDTTGLAAAQDQQQAESIVDARREETFTLESFESLIKAAHAVKKDFLLARVTTVDPQTGDSGKLYYSYYAAQHLNKQLFRTQPERGLLHRMRARNPLNNMTIVGEVHYFAVTPEAVDMALERFERMKTERTIAATRPLGADGSDHDVVHEHGHEQSKPVPKDSLKKMLGVQHDLARLALKNNIDDATVLHHRRSRSESSSWDEPNLANTIDPGLVRQCSVVKSLKSFYDNPASLELGLSSMDDELPIVYDAEYLANDDDFLMKAEIRDYFRINSIQSDDFLLFQLNPPGDAAIMMMNENGQPVSATAPRPGGWRYLWGALTPPSSSIMTSNTGVLSRRAFRWAALVYIAVCVVVIKFAVPPALIFVGAMLSLVILGAVALMFVECGYTPELGY